MFTNKRLKMALKVTRIKNTEWKLYRIKPMYVINQNLFIEVNIKMHEIINAKNQLTIK